MRKFFLLMICLISQIALNVSSTIFIFPSERMNEWNLKRECYERNYAKENMPLEPEIEMLIQWSKFDEETERIEKAKKAEDSFILLISKNENQYKIHSLAYNFEFSNYLQEIEYNEVRHLHRILSNKSYKKLCRSNKVHHLEKVIGNELCTFKTSAGKYLGFNINSGNVEALSIHKKDAYIILEELRNRINTMKIFLMLTAVLSPFILKRGRQILTELSRGDFAKIREECSNFLFPKKII